MTTRISADIHFGPADLRHKYHPGDDKCHAYGVLKIDSGDTTGANLFFDNAAHVRAVIAELALLAAEMDPPVVGCPCVADAPAERDLPKVYASPCTDKGDHEPCNGITGLCDCDCHVFAASVIAS